MSLSNYAEGFARHLRLALLQLLAEASEYSLNSIILTDSIGQIGMNASAAQVRTELAWLKELGLVTIVDLAPMQVATLTERGHDVARGRSIVPGVSRPAPKG